MELVTDEQGSAPLDPETNSIAALESLSELDLVGTVTIRGELHSVVRAVDGQVEYYALYVGQIVLLARHFAGHRVAGCAQELICGVQPAGGIGTGEPEVNHIILKGYAKH
jgi:hypothetical protein